MVASLARLGTALRCGELYRLDDLRVAGAAAQVARERVANVGVARGGVALEQRVSAHHHARSAEPALHATALDEGLLQLRELASRADQPLHREDLEALDLERRGQTRAHRAPCHHHRARA